MTREVVTINYSQTLADAISLIAVHHFHHLLVANTDGKLVGIVSDRDILRSVARTTDWQAYEISKMMTDPPVTVTAESSLVVAVSKMLSKKFNSLPVVTRALDRSKSHFDRYFVDLPENGRGKGRYSTRTISACSTDTCANIKRSNHRW
jgi:CBS domain-containing protein